MSELTLTISGMSCGGCVASVTRALQAQQGVEAVNVTLAPPQAHIRYDAAVIGQQQLENAIEDAGYDIVRG